MRRVVSLSLPTWPTDRLRRSMGASAPPPDAPLVLVGRDGRKRMVLAADAAAQGFGLHPGMAVAKAQALVAELTVMDADREADDLALDRLALWALRRYAPIVAPDPPDGLMIDIAGASHLKGGEAALLDDLTERLASAGIHARTAVAPSYGAAHALARFGGEDRIVAEDEIADRLSPLPVAALRLTPVTVEGLRRLGFEIGSASGRGRR